MHRSVHVRQGSGSKRAGLLAVFSVVALMVGSIETARAAVVIERPTATLTADGVVYDIGIIDTIDETTGKITYAFGSRANGEIIPWSLTIDNNFSVTVDGVLDRDPSITYGATVTDFGAPSSFLFNFSLPIVPVFGPNQVKGTLSGGLIDATGDGISLTPTASALQMSFVADTVTATGNTSMGVDVGTAASFGASTPGAAYIYGPFNSGLIAGPTGPPSWDTLVIQTGFTLSGNGDTVALGGFASIDRAVAAVPEPGTMISAAVGVGLLALLRGRRRRAAA